MKKLATLLCMKSGNFQSSHHNKHETTNANAWEKWKVPKTLESDQGQG